MRTRLSVGAGAAAEWLPQETILFDRCALDRRLDIDLAADAWFLGVEMLVFGRAAMGETVRQACLRDLIRVRRGGDLLLHDAIRLDGAVDGLLAASGDRRGARAMATLVYVAPDAEALLAPVRQALAARRVPGRAPGTACWSRASLAPDRPRPAQRDRGAGGAARLSSSAAGVAVLIG